MEFNLSSSLEDYLEAILNLKREKGEARVTDIGIALGVKKSSVNVAIKKLKELELVEQEKYEDVNLTDSGKEYAEAIKTRHDTLFKFLNSFLLLSEENSSKDACEMEHVLSPASFKRFEKFISFIGRAKLENGDSVIEGFKKTLE